MAAEAEGERENDLDFDRWKGDDAKCIVDDESGIIGDEEGHRSCGGASLNARTIVSVSFAVVYVISD